MTDIADITDPEELLDAITVLADQRKRIDDEIRAQTVRAVHHLGAKRYSAAAAAMISRPTLNAWLETYAETAGSEWDNVGG